MSACLSQPVGQKLLTNVAIVRMKKTGVRFEIACYKNSVTSWRAGVEKDIDEVLQIQQVFSNVSKGVKAKPADMRKAFGSMDELEICKLILEKGDLQLSEREREVHLDQLFKEVVHIVAAKCVDPESKRPLTVGVVEKMMREARITPKMGHNAKQQALEVIRTLETKFPIMRASMRLRISYGQGDAAALRASIKPLVHTFEESRDSSTLIVLIAPSDFREVDALVREKGFTLEVLSTSVHETGESNLGEQSTQKPGAAAAVSAPAPKPTPAPAVAAGDGKKQLGCTSCGPTAIFADAKEHREHFKSEWHRCNLKRKVDSLAPLDLATFEQIAVLDDANRDDFF
mmetsp:Transcript_23004/g.53760  ORF Transcript_23004/g.53760 Transcript_23004/m.53760 type:complete len:343 (-) Transcript_23004:16-1044(-)